MNKILVLIFFALFATFANANHQPSTVIVKPGPAVCTESCSGGNCIRSCI